MWEESAALVRTHDGMNGRMHDHIRRFGQPFDLLGCRRRPWWQRYVVAGISANHHAAGNDVPLPPRDRKSTRLNSSHLGISYAVFCLKKKKKTKTYEDKKEHRNKAAQTSQHE